VPFNDAHYCPLEPQPSSGAKPTSRKSQPKAGEWGENEELSKVNGIELYFYSKLNYKPELC